MKKSIRKFALLGVCALSLTACGEVKFADFQTKAKEALNKTVDYTKAEVSGTIKAADGENKSESKISKTLNVTKERVFTITSLTDIEGAVYASLLSALGLGTFTVTENTSYKYYAGSTFKVAYDATEDDGTKSNVEIVWNDVGLITSFKGLGTGSSSKTTYNLSVKYSK